jgi:hypothetical protein
MSPTLYPLDYFVLSPELSVLLSIVGILGIVVLTVYLYVLLNISYIKQTWDSQKCGYGIVIGDYNNLVECSQKALKKVVDTTSKPLYDGANMVTGFFKDLIKKANVIADILVYIKNGIMSLIGSVLKFIYKLILPIQIFFITCMTLFSKVKGILVSQLYFIVATVITMKSFLEAMINGIIIVLMALAALIILMMIIPFGWGVAALFIAIFVSISIPLGIFVGVMSKAANITIFKIPKVPHVCFDKDTRLELQNKKFVTIKNVKIGDVLIDGSIITATMILHISNAKMFYLHNVLVTGSHLVYYNNTWITVADHPESIHLSTYSEPYVYCVNTTTGMLQIGSNKFTDWNEMMVDDFVTYPECSMIELKNNIIPINQCKIGDVLMDSRIITGIVTTCKIKEPGYWYQLYYN